MNALRKEDEFSFDGHSGFSLKKSEYLAIRDIVYQNFGIVLSEEKRGLIIGRLQSILAKRQLSCFEDYVKMVRADSSGQILSELANQICTNHTSFFREATHFQFFREHVMPQMISKLESENSTDIRIWCAACSSGEEAYTIQMTVMESLQDQYYDFDAGLLATDISTKVLNQAIQGSYSSERSAEIPKYLLYKYFSKMPDGTFQAKDFMKKEILFRRLNLINDRFPLRKFHAIFCRNVMIYFDSETKKRLVRRLYDHLSPGGVLFLGHSEANQLAWAPFKQIGPAVYLRET